LLCAALRDRGVCWSYGDRFEQNRCARWVHCETGFVAHAAATGLVADEDILSARVSHVASQQMQSDLCGAVERAGPACAVPIHKRAGIETGSLYKQIEAAGVGGNRNRSEACDGNRRCAQIEKCFRDELVVDRNALGIRGSGQPAGAAGPSGKQPGCNRESLGSYGATVLVKRKSVLNAGWSRGDAAVACRTGGNGVGGVERRV